MYRANQDIGIVHAVGPAFDKRRFRAIADSWKKLNVFGGGERLLLVFGGYAAGITSANSQNEPS
jgi:hypothetical protein